MDIFSNVIRKMKLRIDTTFYKEINIIVILEA